MFIDLYDFEQEQHITVSAHYEYSVNLSNYFVIFIKENETCVLHNNNKSSPYNQFYVKKISHISALSFTYENKKNSIEVGYIFSENEPHHFILKQGDENGYGHRRFGTPEYYDFMFDKVKIFSMEEVNMMKEFQEKKESLKSTLSRIVHDELNENDFNLYRLISSEGNPRKEVLSNKGFNFFLDEEEKRTAKN